MFEGEVRPWECGDHVPVDVVGLGRTWPACSRCGFLVDPADRERLMQFMQEDSAESL
jgi:hypothetical protein